MNGQIILREEALTVPEVAKMLGVKNSTVRAWNSRREIQAFKMENRRYLPRRQIAEFFERRGNSEFVDLTYANGPIRS
jgi:excisionase family DNA binding protein